MSSSSTPSAVPATTKYTLDSGKSPRAPASLRSGIKRFAPLVADEKRHDVEQIPVMERRRRAMQAKLIVVCALVLALAALIVTVLTHA